MRLRPNSLSSKSVLTNVIPIRIVEIAATDGSKLNCRYDMIDIGSVIVRASTRNSEIFTSSNERMKPKTMPATMPGRMIGSTTFQRILGGDGPGASAGSHRLG